MNIRSFKEAERFLFSYIPKTSSRKFPGKFGLSRAKYFLRILGDPQEKIKIIHVAGTSGKGSTAYLISLMLKSLKFQSLRFKVGLHLSPHLLDIRERVQINNTLLSKQKFVRYLNKLLPAIQKMQKTRYGSPTYFEILAALAYYIFWKEKVDYAVMETGLGGLYDGTNVVQNPKKLCVITKIGMDHMRVLGRTLGAIARQKAGIIQKGNSVISIQQKRAAEIILLRSAVKKDAKLEWVRINKDFGGITLNQNRTIFRFRNLGRIRLGLVGAHQAENAALALTAVGELSRRDGFKFDTAKIRKALVRAHFRGRFEIRHTLGRLVILDGAHNPQKAEALANTLRRVFPGRKLIFLVAFKKGKEYQKILRIFLPLAREFVLTSFFVSNQDLVHLSEKPEAIALAFDKMHVRDYKIISNPRAALRQALAENHYPIVITGSFYLLAELYSELSKLGK